MISIKISIIHVGRYRMEVFNDQYAGVEQPGGIVSETGLVNSFDCGSAGLMVNLSKMIFQPEAMQYIQDQRRSSDDLSNEVLEKMLNDPQYADPKAQRLIQSRIKR